MIHQRIKLGANLLDSHVFQFDFLNDSLDKLPEGLLDALKADKPIVFFLNPPYARSGGMGKTTRNADADKTMVNKQMKADKIGACSANLYAQFLYRILLIKKEFNLTNCHIALFSPTLFLTGVSWAKFRDAYLNEFAFDNAIQFKASHFSDVATNWGISFSLWHNGVTENKTDFDYTLVDSIEGEIVETEKKVLYNTDNTDSISKWYNVDAPKIRDFVTLKSALNFGNKTLKTPEHFIGYYVSGSNIVEKNAQECRIQNAPNDGGKENTVILPENFDKITALFAARKLITCDWKNSKDEYLIPNTDSPLWNEFVNDSLIYSLFNTSSNQSSLTGIKNEWFWRSAAEMAEKANACGNDEMYNDARVSSDRYVYTKLQGISLSKEAQAVLDKANEILDATMKRRIVFNEEHPEYQVNNFDCGWYQIKAMATKEELKEFKVLFDRLADKMHPMVYELGFLK